MDVDELRDGRVEQLAVCPERGEVQVVGRVDSKLLQASGKKKFCSRLNYSQS